MTPQTLVLLAMIELGANVAICEALYENFPVEDKAMKKLIPIWYDVHRLLRDSNVPSVFANLTHVNYKDRWYGFWNLTKSQFLVLCPINYVLTRSGLCYCSELSFGSVNTSKFRVVRFHCTEQGIRCW